MQKRSLDCKVVLYYDGKLNVGVKLGSIGYFTATRRVLHVVLTSIAVSFLGQPIFGLFLLEIVHIKTRALKL